jgi:hypothetical protein
MKQWQMGRKPCAVANGFRTRVLVRRRFWSPLKIVAFRIWRYSVQWPAFTDTMKLTMQ